MSPIEKERSKMSKFMAVGLVCTREDRLAICNLPQRHKHHSPDGFEWGYAGSGPADLALNCLAELVPARSDNMLRVKCWDGTYVSATAWLLHQGFKAAFIQRMPREGGTVPLVTIETWLASERQAAAFLQRAELYQPEKQEPA